MSLKTEWVRYGANQEYSGYAAWPERATLPLPAVLVFQEAWGVNDHIEDVTRRLAYAGYVAFAPDLYAKDGARPEAFTRERLRELLDFMNTLPPGALMDPKAREAALSVEPEDRKARIGSSLQTLFGGNVLSAVHYVGHITAASAFLRHDFAPSRGQRIAAVGFCMGGGVAVRLACHDPELAGAANFYGAPPPPELVPNIQCPVLGFYGSLDTRLVGGVPGFIELMKQHGKTFEPHIYEGAPHAFFNDTRPVYHVDATRDSYARLLQFLREVLAPR